MRKFVVNTDGGGEYVCQLHDSTAKEIAHNGCNIGPLKEGTHTNPIMDQNN